MVRYGNCQPCRSLSNSVWSRASARQTVFTDFGLATLGPLMSWLIVSKLNKLTSVITSLEAKACSSQPLASRCAIHRLLPSVCREWTFSRKFKGRGPANIPNTRFPGRNWWKQPSQRAESWPSLLKIAAETCSRPNDHNMASGGFRSSIATTES